jgi:Putative zinc-finger/Anti-sigma-K factor rskA, C-terminal
VTCGEVRERLPERALGVLEPREAAEIDRHVSWCAACRKESAELTDAAAVLAYAAAPAEPPQELEQRVVDLVHAQARHGGRVHAPGRRGRLAVAAAVAAMVAVSGLGWGAVMAGKAARSEEQATAMSQRSSEAEHRFVELLQTMEFTDPQNDVFLGTLAPGAGGSGGGSAFTLVSPDYIDMAVVMVNGLPAPKRAAMPYEVRLIGRGGRALSVGRIGSLDAGGGAIVAQEFDRDLGPYGRVVVTDADGHVVLSGPLATRAQLASPSP